jgi:hypothetical protein
MMNEIIPTIWIGAPWVIYGWVFIALVVLYSITLEWTIDYNHDRLTWFMLVLLLFLASLGLSWLIGGIL